MPRKTRRNWRESPHTPDARRNFFDHISKEGWTFLQRRRTAVRHMAQLKELRYKKGMSNKQSDGSDENDDNVRPVAGAGERGREFNPGDVPEGCQADRSAPRPAPAPGSPADDDEYDRLKEAARHKRERPGGPAQEDPAGKKTE